MGHDSLSNMYVTNFSMIQHHKYSLSEIESMMPFEREIYIGLLKDYIEKENERVKQEQAKMNRRR